MRVLVVSHTYVTPWYRAKLQLLGAYPDVELHVLVPPSWRGLLGESRAAAASDASYRLWVRPIWGRGHVRRYCFAPGVVPGLLRQLRPDLVYVEAEADSLVLWQFARHRRRFGYRLAFFGWENLPRPGPRHAHPWPQWAMQHLLHRLAAWTLRRVDAAVWGNTEGAGLLRESYGLAREVPVLPQMGVDTALYAPEDPLAARRALGLPPAMPLIGYVGRLVRAKGIMTLLAAAEGWLQTGQAALLLVGGGPLESDIVEWVRENRLSHAVHLLPAVPPQEIPRILPALDVLVLPSESTPTWKEQFGRVLVEAMACGVPVVGSNAGAIPEVIADAGLVFSAGEADALRDALGRLLSDAELRQQLIQRGRTRACTEYDQRVIAGRLHDILVGVLREGEGA